MSFPPPLRRPPVPRLIRLSSLHPSTPLRPCLPLYAPERATVVLPSNRRHYVVKRSRAVPSLRTSQRSAPRVNPNATPSDLLPVSYILSALSAGFIPPRLTVTSVHNLLTSYSTIALPYTPSQHLASTVLRAHPELHPHDLYQIGLLLGKAIAGSEEHAFERQHAARHFMASSMLVGDRTSANFLFESFQRDELPKEDGGRKGSYRQKWETEAVNHVKSHAKTILKDLGLLSPTAGPLLRAVDVNAVDLTPALEAEKKRSADPVWETQARWKSPATDSNLDTTEKDTKFKNKERDLMESLGITLFNFAWILESRAFTPAQPPGVNKLYALAGRFGHGRAWAHLGNLRLEKGDTEGAKAAWKLGCECDDHISFYRLSTVLEPSQTFNDHEECLLTAAASGIIPAAHNLGYLYSQIRKGKNADLESALDWYRVAGVEGGSRISIIAGIRLLLDAGETVEAREWLNMMDVRHPPELLEIFGSESVCDDFVLNYIVREHSFRPFLFDASGTSFHEDGEDLDDPTPNTEAAGRERVPMVKGRVLEKTKKSVIVEQPKPEKKKVKLTREQILEKKIRKLLRG
ncbi:hypothetical protein EX30DRAFT_392963 [Ascodesmis nigricans]|uniref:HCP-like protein n=1 Tax=Ascodesmis nigricans TaxID=341454 RepID=A0A4S2N8F6_9PEZI|nr:hypothetical protein EX30DRAFT_392963 [Ascodesmis nigricans]